MERIFVNHSISFRMWLGLIAVAGAAVLGVWFIGTRLVEGPTEDDGEEALVVGSLLVAIATLGALRLGHYGYQTVLTLDGDEVADRARIALWRPLGEMTVEGRLSEIVDWRYEVGRRNTRMPNYRFRARLAEPRRWLVFEIAPRNEMHPLFLKIAADAVQEFEEQTGIARLRGVQGGGD